VAPVESQGLTQLAGAVGQRRAASGVPPPPRHELDADQGLDRANEHSLGMAFRAGDQVEIPMHAVHEENVDEPGWPEHHFGAARPATGEAMGGTIVRPPVRLDFDDSSGGESLVRPVD
jgi:hypothetical protein